MGVKLSLTPREEHRLRVFENRVLRRIFGPNREEASGGWRRLHKEEIHILYTLPNINRVIRSRKVPRTGHAVLMGQTRNAYKILVEKPERKGRLWRPRRIILEYMLQK